MKKVLQTFSMEIVKLAGLTLPANIEKNALDGCMGIGKLSGRQCPKRKMEKAEMMKLPYASAVRSLMYAMVCTISNIGYVVRVVSRFMSNRSMEHWAATKWILGYLKGTSILGLQFSLGNPLLEGFTYSDMSVDVDINQSTSGYVMTYARGAISWHLRL